MGRTVYGVDLEESPFGGLIEKLLTEEELEKLADGGAPTRPDGRGVTPDGGSDALDDAGSDDAGSDDAGSDDAGSDDESVPDRSDAGTGEDDRSGSEATSWSPPPSTASGDRFGDYGPDPGEDDSADAGLLSRHRWLLLKLAVAFAALAAVAVVVWRYKDRLAGLVPGRGGGEGADESAVDSPSGVATGSDDANGSSARRRAKVDPNAPDADADDEVAGEDDDTPPRRPPRREDAGGVETPGQDVDLGALVGLGVLALVAALVRRYDEGRDRPHDPLVDGPPDEDEVADDDR
jgi:hypothetical protein